MKLRTLATGAAVIALLSLVGQTLVLPPMADECDLGLLILCVELPHPGTPWSLHLSTPGLALAVKLDFALVVASAVFLATLARIRVGPPPPRPGRRPFPDLLLLFSVGAGAMAAAAFDVLENMAILSAIDAPDGAAPGLVRFLAGVKFTLLGLVTGVLALRSNRGLGWIERAGAVLALPLLLVAVWRPGALGSLGLFLAWTGAALDLVVRGRSRRAPASIPPRGGVDQAT